MNKKAVIIFVIGLIAVVLVVIGLSNRRKIAKSEYYTPLESHHSYDALPDKNSKEIYDKMKKCIYSSPKEDEKGDFCFSDIIVDKDTTATQVFLAQKAFHSDNPIFGELGGMLLFLRCRFHTLGLLGGLLDRTDVEEGLLGEMIPFTGGDLLERTDRIFQRGDLTGFAGEDLGDEERLR